MSMTFTNLELLTIHNALETAAAQFEKSADEFMAMQQDIGAAATNFATALDRKARQARKLAADIKAAGH